MCAHPHIDIRQYDDKRQEEFFTRPFFFDLNLSGAQVARGVNFTLLNGNYIGKNTCHLHFLSESSSPEDVYYEK
jgi:hypothetical protein